MRKILRRDFLIGLGSAAPLAIAPLRAFGASSRFTIELRNPDGSVMTTLRLYGADQTWVDINKDKSPLNATQGKVDDTAYNQLHCMDGATEVVRLANCNWDIKDVGRNNAGFCYGCKLGFEKQPRWFLTGID